MAKAETRERGSRGGNRDRGTGNARGAGGRTGGSNARGGGKHGGGGRNGGSAGRRGGSGRSSAGGHSRPDPARNSARPGRAQPARGTGSAPRPGTGSSPPSRPNSRTTSTKRPAPSAPRGKPTHLGLPLSGRISSTYGPRKDPKSGKNSVHRGIDIAVKLGTPVKATGSGVVVKSGWEDRKNHKKGYGQRVTIRHSDGSTSVYGHLGSINVKKGAQVERGQTIGTSGNTGKSTGPHLHYGEFGADGKPRSPRFHPGS